MKAAELKTGTLVALRNRVHAGESWVRVTAVTEKAVQVSFDAAYRFSGAAANCKQWLPKSALCWTGNSHCGAVNSGPEHFDVAAWLIRKMPTAQIMQIWATLNQNDVATDWR